MRYGVWKKVIILVIAIVTLYGIVPGMEFLMGNVYAASSGWTLIDGNLENGLNTDPNKRAIDIQSTIFNNEVYVTWMETDSSYADNYRRVKKFDGTSWSVIDGGSGRNRTASRNMVVGSSIVAYDNAIYLAWTETNPSLGWQIYVDKYDPGTGMWTAVDGGTINRVASNSAANHPTLVVYNSKLYITWSERNASNKDQLHVKRYEGGTTWSFVDGNTDNGLNYNSANLAQVSAAKVFGSDLYVAFFEYTGSAMELRVKKYNGTTWSSADGGNNLNVNSFNGSTQVSLEVFGTSLYMTWLENGDICTKKYDGSTWTLVDEASKQTLYTTPAYANNSKLFSDGSNLYHLFILDGKVKVRKYDGTSWTYIDGNSGINKNLNTYADYPVMAAGSTGVYALWNENNSSYIQQLRAAKYMPLTITPSSALNEANLDTESINISIMGTTFMDSTLNASNISLLNGPQGLTVDSVTYIDDKHCIVNLAFNGTNFDANITNFGIQVNAAELTAGFTLVSINDLTITAYSKPSVMITGLEQGVLKTSVDINAEVTADGGLAITERGIEWKLITESNYTRIADDSNGVGSFSQTLSELTLLKTYNFRAYAVNGQGTSYSSVMNYTPGVKTLSISPPIQDVNSYSETVIAGDNYAAIGYWYGDEKYALKFDLADVQSFWSISNVKLKIYVVPDWTTGSPLLNIKGCIDDDWNETDETRLPSTTGAALLLTYKSIAQSGWLTIEGQEITNFVINQIVDGTASFLLSGPESCEPDTCDDFCVWTKEYADEALRPVLVIEYTETTTLDSIAITTPAAKTAYKVGDTLDITGLVVTGTYSDGSTQIETITAGNVTGFNSTAVVSAQTLTIEVSGKTATYDISVAKADGPALTGVTGNDILNTITGIDATMEFSTNGTDWTAYDAETPNLPDLTGEVALKVRVAATSTHSAGAATTFNFTVATLDSIAITTPAAKTAYKVGDTLDITGLVVTGTYSDGSTQIETITAGNVTGFNSSAVVPAQTLTITVGGKTATYNISVAKAEGPALTGVTSDDILNTITGIDATMEFSTNGTDWTAYNAETPNLPALTGEVALQVRVAATSTHLAGAATTFNFTVATLDSIAITTPAAKTAYKVGDTLDITGLVVTGTYNDGSTQVETITAGNVTGFNSSAVVSAQTLTIEVSGKTATYDISVAKADGPALTGVTSNDILNTITGMDATMEFSTNGTDWTAYDAETSNLPALTGEVALQVRVAATSTHLAGAATTFNFTVATLDSIAITTSAAKTAYKVGDTLDITGLVVTGTYSDGSTQVETITAGNVTGFNSSAVVPAQTLTITVNGKTATYDISVAKADGPALTGVTGNDILNTITGMDATMEFSTNGTDWTAYDAETPNLPALIGEVALQVRVAATSTHLAGAATTFNFTVATLDSIAITTPAAKTAYKVGDTLDITGLVATGTYSDGSTQIETITAGNVTGFNSSAVVSAQTLTITVNGKTATYDISVSKAEGPALAGVTGNDILNTIAGMDATMEFSTNGTDWTAYDAETPNLPALTGEIALQVRVAATSTHLAGAATTFNFAVATLDSIAITTPAAKTAYKVGDTLDITGLVVTGTYSDGSTQVVTITAGNITGFNSTAVVSAQTLTIEVSGKTASYDISVAKADGPAAPAAPVLASKTDTSVTLVANALYQFSKDGTIWQDGEVFTGLTASTLYTFVARVKATATTNESAASLPTEITTNAPPVVEDNTPSIPQPETTGVEILVNGKAVTAAISTTTKVEDKTIVNITVDGEKVDEKLQNEGNNVTVMIPVQKGADVVVGQLNGQTVKNMETKEAVLEIKTENVTYILPASQINIDSVSSQIGDKIALKDIIVSVKISEPTVGTTKIVEDTANKNSYQVVVKPVEFDITCTNGGKTVDVSKFNSYVERTVAIPEGVDPSKITTGIVLNKDGTFSHVPTQIIIIDGKYYAKINSLTNSTYSVIWSPKTFVDVENHWAKNDVNEMGSRLIIDGSGGGIFEPDRDITRAEFATIVVKALGLMRPGEGKDFFSDVANDSWYYDAVSIAYEYQLISGYGDGVFKPENKITREEAMTIISRAMTIAKMYENMYDSDIQSLLDKFDDSNDIANWAKESVALCIKREIVVGSNNKIYMKDNITRAETAAIIRRLLQKANLI